MVNLLDSLFTPEKADAFRRLWVDDESSRPALNRELGRAIIAGGDTISVLPRSGENSVNVVMLICASAPGERSGAWIKLRANRCQDFVIGGYIPGSHGFDALLVGVYENKQLIFVAKVKDGFVLRTRDEIFPALQKLRVVHCPFRNLPEKRASRWGESLTAEKMKECYWVTPKLICQVAFVEWTDAGHLRHCKFVAMRDDKRPGDVVRET
jgi:ATP dependent DNA ligase C terminal region